MSMGPLFIGVAVVLSIASLQGHAENYCADKPDGKYCDEESMGYHNCINSVDYPRGCHVRYTRCKCMGVPCPKDIGSPCATFKDPPLYPRTYELAGYQEITRGTPKTRYSYYYSARDQDNKRFREDITIAPAHDPPYQYNIVLGNGEKYDKFVIVPSKQQCTKTEVLDLPESEALGVPYKFLQDKPTIFNGQPVETWIWKQGGHTADEPISTETYYTLDDTTYHNTVAYRGVFPSGKPGKPDKEIQRDYTFKAGIPAAEYFNLPEYCH